MNTWIQRTVMVSLLGLLPVLTGCPDNEGGTGALSGGSGSSSSFASHVWATAQLIETDNSGGASRPQVAVDASGNAVAVWELYDGTRANIWANRYVAGTNSWGTAQQIETDNGDAGGQQVAVDASGNAVAVWQQYDGTRTNIWANRYVAATNNWGTAQLIETDNTGYASLPQVAMDGNGNAVVVWKQFDATRANIWANRYVAATNSWGTA